MLHAMALAVQDHYYDVHLGRVKDDAGSCSLRRLTHVEYSKGCHGGDGCSDELRHEFDCTSDPPNSPTFCGRPGSKAWVDMLSGVDY